MAMYRVTAEVHVREEAGYHTIEELNTAVREVVRRLGWDPDAVVKVRQRHVKWERVYLVEDES